MSMDYDKDDMMPSKMKKVAGMKVKNKMSKTGKMLDDLEMSDAPRRPFLEKAKPTKMIMTKAMRKGMPPRMRKLKDK